MTTLLQTLESPEDIDSQIIFVKSEVERNENLHKQHIGNGSCLFLKVMVMYENILISPNNKIICNDKSLHTGVCSYCNEPFTPKTSKGKFCSARCRTASHRTK